jgi:hypothetical protein
MAHRLRRPLGIVLWPAPDDQIAAAEGALRDLGPIDIAQMRAAAREDERIAEARQQRQPAGAAASSINQR